MNDQQLLQFGRQILLPQIGIDGQQRLLDAHVLIIGLGGLGSPVALYLAAAGIGQLTLADHDHVELSNLQRQIIHGMDDIGRGKTESAKQSIAAINPHCRVETLNEPVNHAVLSKTLDGIDLVVDASDNFPTRFAINAACLLKGIPLVSGAAVRWEGQITVFSGRKGDGCYRCLFDEAGEDEDTCSTTGVAAPVVGVIGSLQAMETIKVITGAGEPLYNRLQIYDGLNATWRSMKFRADPSCPVCGNRGI